MTPQRLFRRVVPPRLGYVAETPPHNASAWSFELNYDGFRAVSAITSSGVAMLSRNELDLSLRFPRTFEAIKKLKIKDVVLDGEVVVLDEKGAPRFQLLQQSSGRERLILFDVLWLDGHDLRQLTYLERREVLEKLFRKPPAGIEIAQRLEMTGEQALALAAKSGFEGIIAKKNSSCYETRRSKEWLKIKAIQQQELVIIGWQPS